MFENLKQEKDYIRENFPDITSSHVGDDHWDLLCGKCGVVRGFDVYRRGFTTEGTQYRGYTSTDFQAVRTELIVCPVCMNYKVLLYYKIPTGDKDKYYKVTEIPEQGMQGIQELPDKPASLRKAYREAIKSAGAGAYMAAAVMFRRSLQVITRDIGKVNPGNLANELSELVGKQINSVTFTQDFSQVGYIIKEAGNQTAHPDEDPDLLDFTQQDASDLQTIFMSLVAEIFIAPKAAEEAKERFLQSRKIIPK